MIPDRFGIIPDALGMITGSARTVCFTRRGTARRALGMIPDALGMITGNAWCATAVLPWDPLGTLWRAPRGRQRHVLIGAPWPPALQTAPCPAEDAERNGKVIADVTRR